MQSATYLFETKEQSFKTSESVSTAMSSELAMKESNAAGYSFQIGEADLNENNSLFEDAKPDSLSSLQFGLIVAATVLATVAVAGALYYFFYTHRQPEEKKIEDNAGNYGGDVVDDTKTQPSEAGATEDDLELDVQIGDTTGAGDSAATMDNCDGMEVWLPASSAEISV